MKDKVCAGFKFCHFQCFCQGQRGCPGNPGCKLVNPNRAYNLNLQARGQTNLTSYSCYDIRVGVKLARRTDCNDGTSRRATLGRFAYLRHDVQHYTFDEACSMGTQERQATLEVYELHGWKETSATVIEEGACRHHVIVTTDPTNLLPVSSIPILPVAPVAPPSKTATALAAFFTQMNGTGWVQSRGWTQGEPCEDPWYGIKCDDSGEVVGIFLNENNLTGMLPGAVLGSLKSLRMLVLDGNSISGRVPLQLRQMNHLSLTDNQLTMPDSYDQWKEVKDIVSLARKNMLMGGFPPVDCSAFGKFAVPSLFNVHKCVDCSHDIAGPLLLLVAVSGVALLLLYKYFKAVKSDVKKMHRYALHERIKLAG